MLHRTLVFRNIPPALSHHETGIEMHDITTYKHFSSHGQSYDGQSLSVDPETPERHSLSIYPTLGLL
jgi:hypothetical protein